MLKRMRGGRAEVIDNHSRVVPERGTPASTAAMEEADEPRPSFEWRGLGEIDARGLRILDAFATFDAGEHLGAGCAANREPAPAPEPCACACGQVMTGRIEPTTCPQRGMGWTPAMPLGTLMASPEGACAARWQYGGRRAATVMEPAE